MKLLLIGAPGSGKGTQAERLMQNHGYQVLTVSTLLRQQLDKQGKLGETIRQTMDAGLLVSDNIVWQVITDGISAQDSKQGIVLDGYPRSLSQLEQLTNSTETFDAMFYFQVTEDVVVARISGRRVHLPSGRVYHVDFAPPKVAGLDDVTGEPLVHRDDDKPDVVRKRMLTFTEKTQPIVDQVKADIAAGRGVIKRLITLNADQSIDNVTKDIDRCLKA